MDLKEAKSKPYFWTCFAFEKYDPNDLHCTHKFLADLSNADAATVLNAIDEYFTIVKFEPINAVFDQVAMFGANKDVRVLKTKAPLVNFHLELREIIDPFRKDDFPYSPHVTTAGAFASMKSIELPLVKYCFMRGKEILHSWG